MFIYYIYNINNNRGNLYYMYSAFCHSKRFTT